MSGLGITTCDRAKEMREKRGGINTFLNDIYGLDINTLIFALPSAKRTDGYVGK